MDVLPSGTYVVAVSGGVDSIVLLDMLASRKNLALVVAHFDHGVRADSATDAKFVGELAKEYGLRFETKREELGAGASEELARIRRYEFLRSVAKNHQAKIITAHHADDVVETIAINLIRGTGWRGVAVLDSEDIMRPLIHMRKSELIKYAKEHDLTWHEDSTNASDDYLRNRLRKKLAGLDEDTRLQLLALRDHQVHQKHEIENESRKLIGQPPYSRHYFISIDEPAAHELLRTIFIQETGYGPLAPQLHRALMAIKVGHPGSLHDVGGGIRLEFTRTGFVVNRG